MSKVNDKIRNLEERVNKLEGLVYIILIIGGFILIMWFVNDILVPFLKSIPKWISTLTLFQQGLIVGTLFAIMIWIILKVLRSVIVFSD